MRFKSTELRSMSWRKVTRILLGSSRRWLVVWLLGVGVLSLLTNEAQLHSSLQENKKDDLTTSTSSYWRFVGFRKKTSNVMNSTEIQSNVQLWYAWADERTTKWCAPPNASGILESPRLVHSTDYVSEAPPLSEPGIHDYTRLDYTKLEKESAIDEILLPVKPENNNRNNETKKNETHAKAIPKFGTQRVASPVIRKAAVCKPSSNDVVAHFPHTMQELFMCFDYWIDSHCSDDEELGCVPVLLYGDDNGPLKKAFQNVFVRGVLEFLESSLALITISTQEYYDCHQTKEKNAFCSILYHPEQTIRSFIRPPPQGYLFQHAKEWNKRMGVYLDVTGKEEAPEPSWAPSNQGRRLSKGKRRNVNPFAPTGVDLGACPGPPRIGILNRRNTREILNADELTKDLSQLVYVYERAGKTNSRSNNSSSFDYHPQFPVTETYFEKKSFQEQVEFFRETDIVISGHGAQLTGIAFMANDASTPKSKSCKHVVELFPKNYAIPYFFGSLAVQSGIGHSYVYYDDGLNSSIGEPSFGDPTLQRAPLMVVKPWEQIVSNTYRDRATARKSQLCPRSEDVVDYLSQIVTEWYRCHGC